MQKIARIFLGIFLFASGAMAQESQSFEKGDILINTGFSFGYYQYGLSGQRKVKILPTTASFEYGFTKTFSLGPYVGFASWNYPLYDLNFISVGGRLSWHFAGALKNLIPDLNLRRWDIYATGIVGWELRDVAGYNGLVDEYENRNKFLFGPNLGIKYLFNSKTGVFAEGGKGTFGYGTMGVAFKF